MFGGALSILVRGEPFQIGFQKTIGLRLRAPQFFRLFLLFLGDFEQVLDSLAVFSNLKVVLTDLGAVVFNRGGEGLDDPCEPV